MCLLGFLRKVKREWFVMPPGQALPRLRKVRMEQTRFHRAVAEALRHVPDQRGYTALEAAIATGGDINAFNELLDATALRYAVTRSSRAVEMLLEAGADPEETQLHPWDRYKPLLWAVQQGKQQAIEVLLKHGADPNAWWEPDNSTALMSAVQCRPPVIKVGSGRRRYNPVSVVRMLVDAGADINVMNDRQETAVDLCRKTRQHLATDPEHVATQEEMLEILGPHVSEPWEADRWAQVPVDRRNVLLGAYAFLGRSGKVREGLERYGKEFSSLDLHLALCGAAGGSVDVARMLLDSGAPVSASVSDPEYVGPLALAKRSGNLEMVKLLIECGAK